MADLIRSIEAEYQRFKALAEGAIAQLDESQLSQPGPSGGNSIAIICWHLSGNLRSRFTEFLASDGEKPWRRREEEFQARTVTRAELLSRWNEGWEVLFKSLAELSDEHLNQTVLIRRQPFRVYEALLRSLGHAGYHVGQIVYLAKSLRGKEWSYLSIPPGQSDAYNANPTKEHAAAHASALADLKPGPI
jgi:hypothetical protein